MVEGNFIATLKTMDFQSIVVYFNILYLYLAINGR